MKNYNLSKLLKKAEPQIIIRWYPKDLKRYDKNGKIILTDDELEYLSNSDYSKALIFHFKSFLKKYFN